jgi:hypothetical protein
MVGAGRGRRRAARIGPRAGDIGVLPEARGGEVSALMRCSPTWRRRRSRAIAG